MSLIDAGTAEIVRSHQKDEYYANFVRSSLNVIVQRVAGPRVWMKWRKELEVFADLCYFSLTTMAGYQTLGEEYVYLVQVDPSKRRVPSVLRRAIMVFLHVCFPYLTDKSLNGLERLLRQQPNVFGFSVDSADQLLRYVSVARKAVMLIYRCNLAIFYLNGIFYHLSKRFTSVRYLQVKTATWQDGALTTYRLLGYLSLTQLIFAAAHYIYVNRDNLTTMFGPAEQGFANAEQERCLQISPQLKCALCLDKRIDSTVTPCGHLFCWQCIMDWVKNKAECPLCREKFNPSRLLYLQNYDSKPS